MNKYFKITLCLLGGIVLSLILIVSVYFLPVERMRYNVASSVETFLDEGTYPERVKGFKSSKLDNFTDALMLNIAIYDSEELLKAAMQNPVLAYGDTTNPIYDLECMFNGAGEMRVWTYGRYWHGYLVILKPLLLFFDYQEIRMLNLFVENILLFIVLVSIIEKLGKKYAFAFLLTVLILNPISLAQNMFFSNVYYIMLITTFVLLKKNEWLKKSFERYGILFLISGMATCFFDLLTYPFITLGIPLIIFVVVNEEKIEIQIKRIIGLSVAWGVGYGGIWLGKWLLASAITETNILGDALNTALFRIGGTAKGEAASWGRALEQNFSVINNSVVIFVGLMLLALLLICLITRKYRIVIPQFYIILPLLIVGIYPVIWYGVLQNHSIIHAFFAYRELSILVFAGLCIGAKCIRTAKR